MSDESIVEVANNPALDAKEVLDIEAVEGSVRLRVGVDVASSRLIIRHAGYEGAADDLTRRALDRLCAIIVERPLQEAADHGVIYAAAAAPEDCAPVDGIRTPRNAGASFVLAEKLLRQVHTKVCNDLNIGHRENAWYLRPSQGWLAQDEKTQANLIKPIIVDFLRANGLDEDAVFICRIERGNRVTVGFSEHVSYTIKPTIMLWLEKLLRRETGHPLELFMDEMKDANRIRRL
jgi:hypothetical protein